MEKLILAIFLVLILSCTDEAVVKQSHWNIYKTDNSMLPSNQVQAIAIENDIKWIGTPEGLTRIEGDQWVTYTSLNSLLPSKFITAIAADNAGNTWIGTDKGLSRFDGSKWTVVEKLTNQFITKLQYHYPTNTLWIGTDKGLVKYDGTTWERYDDPGSTLMDMYVSSLAVESNGTLWMGSFDHFAFVGRLLKYEDNTWTSYKLDQRDLNSCFPDVLTIDAEDVLWMGIKGTMGGMVVRIQGETWDIFNRFNADCFEGGGVTSIVLADNKKWITSATGLTSFDNIAWNCFTKTNSELPDDHILTMAIDSDGNKWMGTLTHGLIVWLDPDS
jgi:ligand-binding sensor domain-containing protein